MSAPTVVDDAVTNELWRDELTREIAEEEAEGVVSQVSSILFNLLATYHRDDPVAAREAAQEAARRIDDDYRTIHIPSDPLLRATDGASMAGFLWHLYGLVHMLARHVTYDDARQDALVQCIAELQRLPTKAFRIYNEDCLVYAEEPVFPIITHDAWNANFPSAARGEHLDGSKATEFKRRCDEWINFSAFLARCTAAGIEDRHPERYLYPSVDIPLGLGLKEELPPGELRDCRLMVALQWLLHCGGRLRTDMIEGPGGTWNLDEWNRWIAKLREIEEEGTANAKLKAAVGATLAQMASLAS